MTASKKNSKQEIKHPLRSSKHYFKRRQKGDSLIIAETSVCQRIHMCDIMDPNLGIKKDPTTIVCHSDRPVF